MKNLTPYFFLLALIIPFTSIGQKVEISPFAGYFFSGRTSIVGADINIRDNIGYGLALDVAVNDEVKVEAFYQRVQTNTVINRFRDLETEDFETTVEYYQIGGMNEFSDDMVRPFAIVTLGASRISPKTPDYSDLWAFSMTLGGGAKIFISDAIGIRLQGRLMAPMYFNGLGLYCGAGSGGASCGGGASFGTYFIQGDLTAGLIIAID